MLYLTHLIIITFFYGEHIVCVSMTNIPNNLHFLPFSNVMSSGQSPVSTTTFLKHTPILFSPMLVQRPLILTWLLLLSFLKGTYVSQGPSQCLHHRQGLSINHINHTGFSYHQCLYHGQWLSTTNTNQVLHLPSTLIPENKMFNCGK